MRSSRRVAKSRMPSPSKSAVTARSMPQRRSAENAVEAQNATAMNARVRTRAEDRENREGNVSSKTRSISQFRAIFVPASGCESLALQIDSDRARRKWCDSHVARLLALHGFELRLCERDCERDRRVVHLPRRRVVGAPNGQPCRAS